MICSYILDIIINWWSRTQDQSYWNPVGTGAHSGFCSLISQSIVHPPLEPYYHHHHTTTATTTMQKPPPPHYNHHQHHHTTTNTTTSLQPTPPPHYNQHHHHHPAIISDSHHPQQLVLPLPSSPLISTSPVIINIITTLTVTTSPSKLPPPQPKKRNKSQTKTLHVAI